MNSSRTNLPETKGILIRWASLCDFMGRIHLTGRERQSGEWTDLVELDPENLDALYQVGRIGALTGEELELAQASLEQYLSRPAAPGRPSHAGAYWRLGMIHEHRGDFDLARAAYEESLRLRLGYEPSQAALAALNERLPQRRVYGSRAKSSCRATTRLGHVRGLPAGGRLTVGTRSGADPPLSPAPPPI